MARRRDRRDRSSDGIIDIEDVGIENRIVGCATFEKSYCRPGEKVIHLTLVAVHRRHRKIGVGHKLIEFIKVKLYERMYPSVVFQIRCKSHTTLSRYSATAHNIDFA